jgi:hypothetical protein
VKSSRTGQFREAILVADEWLSSAEVFMKRSEGSVKYCSCPQTKSVETLVKYSTNFQKSWCHKSKKGVVCCNKRGLMWK